MKQSISKQLGIILVRRLVTILVTAIFFSVLLLFVLNYSKQREIESTLSDALGYALQEPIKNWDLVSITRTIESFHKANETARFCVLLDNETVLSSYPDCEKASSRIYNIPFSNYQVTISVHVRKPLQFIPPIITLVAMIFVLAILIVKIKKTGSMILKDIHCLGSKISVNNFSYIETAASQKKILAAEELIKEHENMRAKIEMGHIATQVAHDIRSPLSSVQAAAEYLGQMRIEDPKAGEVLNLLELSAKRLTGIADDLLKKHKGGVEEKSDFSIHQVLDELVGEFQGQEKYRLISFVKQYSSKAIHIQGNGGKLQRAFGNIIKNGAEAMGFNGTVTLGTREEDGKVVVSLSDTGPGMAPEKLEKVLGGGFTDGKADGHGIGMKVVKETAEEHGGRLWGESVLGKGTVFFIELTVTTHKSSSETFTLTLASKGPVLVVDDDAGLREQWKLTLKDQGIKTLLCDSMEDLLRQKISSHLTKTAVVDYHFDNSEKTGAEIIQHLKEKEFTNVYLCTAEYWKPSVQKLAKDLGVEICPKPLPKIVIAKQSNGANGIASVAKLPRNDNGGYTVLVIDDDLGIRMSWEMMQKKLGITKLHAYANLEALQKENCLLDGIDIAFVDKNIEGSQFNGAQVIQHLKENGVTKVALASGESEETLRQDPQFSTADFIIGKNIPTDFKAFFS